MCELQECVGFIDKFQSNGILMHQIIPYGDVVAEGTWENVGHEGHEGSTYKGHIYGVVWVSSNLGRHPHEV